MSSRNSFKSVLMACLLATGFVGIGPGASAEPGGRPLLTPGKSAWSHTIKRRDHGTRILLPIGPSYIYYDYPYYYSRGYYPTHIGGYVYYH